MIELTSFLVLCLNFVEIFRRRIFTFQFLILNTSSMIAVFGLEIHARTLHQADSKDKIDWHQAILWPIWCKISTKLQQHKPHLPVMLSDLTCTHMYTVSQQYDTALACYNYDVYQPLLIIFGRNDANKESSQIMPPHLTSASALPGKTESRKICDFGRCVKSGSCCLSSLNWKVNRQYWWDILLSQQLNTLSTTILFAFEQHSSCMHQCMVWTLHSSTAAAQTSQLHFSWPMAPTNQSWTQFITRFSQSTAAWMLVASQQNWRNQAATGWSL